MRSQGWEAEIPLSFEKKGCLPLQPHSQRCRAGSRVVFCCMAELEGLGCRGNKVFSSKAEVGSVYSLSTLLGRVSHWCSVGMQKQRDCQATHLSTSFSSSGFPCGGPQIGGSPSLGPEQDQKQHHCWGFTESTCRPYTAVCYSRSWLSIGSLWSMYFPSLGSPATAQQGSHRPLSL